MEYIVLFFTHSGAIKFDRKCKQNGITSELMPVPRELSSNCGISAKIKYEGEIADLIADEIENIFLQEDGTNVVIYEAD